MEKGIRFNSNELFTILDINHPEGRYFFDPIFEIFKISTMSEYCFPKRWIINILICEVEIRFALIKTEKSHNHIVTKKCFQKNIEKHQCWKCVGWRCKKVAVNKVCHFASFLLWKWVISSISTFFVEPSGENEN